jgi:cyanobactin maturation PatA/PatG family protease
MSNAQSSVAGYAGFSAAADPLAAIRQALSSARGGAPDVTVALVGGLPDRSHPALRDARLGVVAAMVPDSANAPDGHGTQICSVIFGNGDGVVGLAPNCTGLALPIFFGRADGGIHPASQIDLARAIAFALERGADIINVSAGQKTDAAEAETHLAQALARCRANGALVVAAAGNDGCACIHLPAALGAVIAVGALGPDGQPLPVSNWGQPYRRNGLLAPGGDLVVARPGGGIARASGTSFATAVVSGVAALLLSIARRHAYAIDASEIGRILLDTATPCELPGDGACDRYLAGTLDAAAALDALHRAGRRGDGAHAGSATTGHVRPLAGPPIMVDKGETFMGTKRIRSATRPAVMPSACACQTNTTGDTAEHDIDVEDAEEELGEALEADADDEGFDAGDDGAPVLPQGARARRSGGRGTLVKAGMRQLGCGCGGGEPPQIVFVLGALWFDFGTEARYDAIVQQMGDPIAANNPPALFAFLRQNRHFASGLTFILMQDQIPLYAVQPAGPFALDIYDAMLDALESCLDDSGREQRVSIPGFISGSTRLMNGMTVPVIYPDLRGMYKWRSQDLIQATQEALSADAEKVTDDEILNFLNRVYYELRNLGIAPQERALNFAATNAYQARQAFADASARHLALDSIEVTKSPICRPDSDCWDVQLAMFDPENERRASRVYRYTVDVSEVLPVTVGAVRTWAARA